MRLLPRTSTAMLAVLLGTVLAAGPALAGGSPGDLGHDVSQVDCSRLPAVSAFAVVAVTGDPADGGGRPYNQNPCLATETAWAASLPGTPALYVNTANPGPASIHWPTREGEKPVPCSTADPSSPGCAYGYGWNAAADALARARATITAFDPVAVTWWLDVETINSWVGTTWANTADLQGYADRLRSAGVPSVGLYAASAHWTEITGGLTQANAATYRQQWAFSPLYPIELGPTWAPGASTADEAATRCGAAAFTGPPPLLTQYPDGNLDGDRQCAAESTDVTAPRATITSPTLSHTLGTLRVSWLSDGSGVSSFDVRYRSAAWNHVFGGYAYPKAWQVTRANSATQSTVRGTTYCFSVRARDARANLSGWSAQRCTTVPLDDRMLTASSGWTRSTSTAFYVGSALTTTHYGATLTRAGAFTNRLALVATRCPTCGTVGVYVGSTLIGKVDLRASASYPRWTFLLPSFSLRTGTVTVKVLSSGKKVQVDGLSVGHV